MLEKLEVSEPYARHDRSSNRKCVRPKNLFGGITALASKIDDYSVGGLYFVRGIERVLDGGQDSASGAYSDHDVGLQKADTTICARTRYLAIESERFADHGRVR